MDLHTLKKQIISIINNSDLILTCSKEYDDLKKLHKIQFKSTTLSMNEIIIA